MRCLSGLFCWYVISVLLVFPARAEDAIVSDKITPLYTLPWEEGVEKENKNSSGSSEEELFDIDLGRMDLIKMKRDGYSVISSHPEMADVYIENSVFLFVFGRKVGETNVVVADKSLQPVWMGKIVVSDPSSSGEAGAVPAGVPPVSPSFEEGTRKQGDAGNTTFPQAVNPIPH